MTEISGRILCSDMPSTRTEASQLVIGEFAV
jgi:hypothetical protein